MKTNTRSKSGVLGGWLFTILVTIVSSTADAHHSFAMFDKEHPVSIVGTINRLEWTNPHVYINLMVPKADGAEQYTIECSSISILRRVGWKPSDLKAGTKVTILVWPLRDGRLGGLMDKVTLPDGRAMGNANF
jgi:hypothetical protein